MEQIVLNPNQILLHPKLSVLKFSEISYLLILSKMNRYGAVDPVMVQRTELPSVFYLMNGDLILRAANQLGIETIPCEIY